MSKVLINQLWEESDITTKPFDISKRLVWQAWKHIKANGGSYGVDGVSIDEFEADLTRNLYKLWNRLSSGSYFPPAVRRVDIPKSGGGSRPLGIPTVSDRIAQMVVKLSVEPRIDPIFHPDSYGYRPGKSAIEAVGRAKRRCWRSDWVLDLDIQGFFDNIDDRLLMKAVEKHVGERWICLYIKRWLTAPVAHANGACEARTRGTPQGGVISPLLANLYLHYGLDVWVNRHYPQIDFERYADDAVFHCPSREAAEELQRALIERLKSCGLTLHPDKTKVVYCKDSDRREDYTQISFDFLGYTFRPRKVKSKYGHVFTSFTPSISQKALKRITGTIRDWKLVRWSQHTLIDVARRLNPVIRGWINYYRQFGRGRLYRVSFVIDKALTRWMRKKFKRLKGSYRRAINLLKTIRQQQPKLFVHWYGISQG